MKLCKKCRRTLPFLLAYVAFLAVLPTFVTGMVSEWDIVAMAVVFVLGFALGSCYVTSCSCRLCRIYRHPTEHSHA